MDTIAVEFSAGELAILLAYMSAGGFLTADLHQKIVDAQNRLQLASTDVNKVFSHWQKVHKKERSKLDKKRETRIKNILKTFSVDELKQAIDGALKDDWLMGRGKAPRAYNGIETIFRDVAQVERLMELGEVRRQVTTYRAESLPEVAKGGFL